MSTEPTTTTTTTEPAPIVAYCWRGRVGHPACIAAAMLKTGELAPAALEMVRGDAIGLAQQYNSANALDIEHDYDYLHAWTREELESTYAGPYAAAEEQCWACGEYIIERAAPLAWVSYTDAPGDELGAWLARGVLAIVDTEPDRMRGEDRLFSVAAMQARTALREGLALYEWLYALRGASWSPWLPTGADMAACYREADNEHRAAMRTIHALATGELVLDNTSPYDHADAWSWADAFGSELVNDVENHAGAFGLVVKRDGESGVARVYDAASYTYDG